MEIKDTSAHFIGVGGIGMSALAQLFQSMGAKVSGSDQNQTRLTQELEEKGIKVYPGHSAESIDSSLDVVVYSSAISPTNPEVVAAKKLGIPIIPRAEALAEVMRFKRGIAVGGTHGKTTTTSLISSIFMKSNMDPTIAVGGRLKLIESTARLGEGPWMVAEADESDGSFLRLSPEISIITNIDADHLDHFGSFENLQSAFLNFALNVPFYGSVVVLGDDPRIRELFKNFTKKIYFYGFNSDNDFILKGEGGVYEVLQGEKLLGEFKLLVPGRHNALNALAACIATHLAGVEWENCFAGANAYSGVDRRFQSIGEAKSIRVFDDYAHHPTEIIATIAGAKELAPSAKLHLIYQPHRYTRTKDCWQDYLSCFSGVDHLYLMDIYPAGEQPIEGVSSHNLSEQTQVSASYFADDEALLEEVKASVVPGDIVMTMGAGNVWQVAPKVVKKLEEL